MDEERTMDLSAQEPEEAALAQQEAIEDPAASEASAAAEEIAQAQEELTQAQEEL